MSASDILSSELLAHDIVPSNARGGLKTLAYLLLVASGCVLLCSQAQSTRESPVTMAGLPARIGQSSLPARAWPALAKRSMQPASVRYQAGVVQAMRTAIRSAMPGAPVPQTQLRRVTAAAPVHAAQDKGYTFAGSTLDRLAITAINANGRGNRARDTSSKAIRDEIKVVLASMDEEAKDEVEEVAEKVALKAQDLAGITAPTGFLDPIGFTTDVKEGKLLFYREVELKHGRVAMLASLGILVAEQFHPLFGGNIDVPSYVAFQQTPLQTFWPAVVAAIAIPEIYSVFTFVEPSDQNDSLWAIKSGRQPGDFDFDPLGLKPTDPNEFKEMQTKELNNGRLAMIAAAGMIAQELATGQKLF